jgi:HSP20 family protein
MQRTLNSTSKALFLIVLGLIFLSRQTYAENQADSKIPVSHQTTHTPVPDLDDPTADPFAEMEKMQEGVNQLLRESWKRMRNYQQAGKFFEPDADFVEKDGQYVLKMDLPGMDKDKINIEATGTSIAVSGERQTERQLEDKDGAAQFERSSGSFYRRMSLPSDANTDQIGAKYENGVLEVTIPKKASVPATDAKKIQVQ